MKYSSITENSLSCLVYRFYADVRADDLIGPVFEAALHDKWDIHLPRMVQFWSTMLLGTRNFSGNVYSKHMALDNIQSEHFNRWLTLFQRTVWHLFEPAPAETIMAITDRIAASLQLGYFGEHLVSSADIATQA